MHTIRLRKPWQRTESDGTVRRVDVPDLDDELCDANDQATRLPHASPCEVVYQRNFNLPSGLDGDAIVSLCVDHWSGRLVGITINEKPLDVPTAARTLRLNITDQLDRQNRLAIRLADQTDSKARLDGEVVLSIDHGSV